MMPLEERTEFGLVAIQGTAWRYVSYFGGKFMVFLSSIILARLLSKEDFGVVGYALASIAFLDVASDLGVAEAVVQHKDGKRVYSTAFWIGIGIGIVLFALSWFIAPLLALYFRDDRVISVYRVMALTFPFSALGSTHDAILRKNLSFGKTTAPEFLRAFTKGLTSVVLAFLGFGAWSLVWGQLGGSLVASIILWFITPWRPTFEFDPVVARSLLSYGVKYIGVDILSVMLLNLDYLLIGRYLGAAVLGVYVLAYRIPELIILQFARILSKVIFPIYAKMRDLPGGLARGFGKATSYISLLTVPLGVGLMLVAKPFTMLFLTAKWADAIPVIQALAIYSMLLSLIHNTGSAYKAQGNFNIMAWIGLIRLSILFPALWWAVNVAGSIVAVGWMHALVAFLGSGLSLLIASRILGLPLRDLFYSVWPSLLAGSIMAISILVVLHFSASASPLEQLIIAITTGSLTYFAVLWLVRRELLTGAIKKIYSAMALRQKKSAVV